MKLSDELLDALFFLSLVVFFSLFTAFILSAMQPSQDVDLGSFGGGQSGSGGAGSQW